MKILHAFVQKLQSSIIKKNRVDGKISCIKNFPSYLLFLIIFSRSLALLFEFYCPPSSYFQIPIDVTAFALKNNSYTSISSKQLILQLVSMEVLMILV